MSEDIAVGQWRVSAERDASGRLTLHVHHEATPVASLRLEEPREGAGEKAAREERAQRDMDI